MSSIWIGPDATGTKVVLQVLSEEQKVEVSVDMPVSVAMVLHDRLHEVIDGVVIDTAVKRAKFQAEQNAPRPGEVITPDVPWNQ